MKKMNKDSNEREKHTSRSQNTVLINSVCLLAGVVVFLLCLIAPNKIMVMMDKQEINRLYVKDVNTELVSDSEAISVEQKLELLCDGYENVSVSSAASTMDDKAILAFNKKNAKMAEEAIKCMQDKGILPEIYLGTYDEDVSSYYTLDDDNNLRYYTFWCDYYSIVSLDNMNHYVSIAQITYDMGGDYLSVLMDTDTGIIYEFLVETSVTKEEFDRIGKRIANSAMQEYLGISKSVYHNYYYYEQITLSEKEYEYDASGDEVTMCLNVSLYKEGQINTAIINSPEY